MRGECGAVAQCSNRIWRVHVAIDIEVDDGAIDGGELFAQSSKVCGFVFGTVLLQNLGEFVVIFRRPCSAIKRVIVEPREVFASQVIGQVGRAEYDVGFKLLHYRETY